MTSGTYDKVTTNLQQWQRCLKKSNIINKNQNKIFNTKLPYWFSLSAISWCWKNVTKILQYKRTLVHLYTAFFQYLKQIRITRLLTDSNPSSHRGRGQRSTSRITLFRSRNIPVAISYYSFYLKVMDDWQTQNKSVGCIPHLPSLICKLWKLYDEFITYDKVSKLQICKSRLKINLEKTYEFLSRWLMTNLWQT